MRTAAYAITLGTMLTAAAAHEPPSIESMAASINSVRASVVDLRLVYERELCALTAENATTTTIQGTRYELSKHQDSWSLSLWAFPGPVEDLQRASLHRQSWHDGRRTISLIPARTLADGTTKPNSYLVSPGLDRGSITTTIVGNYLSAAWGEFDVPLDARLTDSAWTAREVAEDMVDGSPVVRVTLTRSTPSELREIYFLSPDHAYLPVRSEAHAKRAGGEWRRLNARFYSDWLLLETGAWLPRLIEYRNPDDPTDVTYDRLKVVTVDQSPIEPRRFTDVLVGPAFVTDTEQDRFYSLAQDGIRTELGAAKSHRDFHQKIERELLVQHAAPDGTATRGWSVALIVGVLSVGAGIVGIACFRRGRAA